MPVVVVMVVVVVGGGLGLFDSVVVCFLAPAREDLRVLPAPAREDLRVLPAPRSMQNQTH